MARQAGISLSPEHQYVATMFTLPPTLLENYLAECMSHFQNMVCKIAGTSEISITPFTVLESGNDRIVTETIFGFNRHVPIELLRKDATVSVFEKRFQVQLCFQNLIEERGLFTGNQTSGCFRYGQHTHPARSH